MCVRSSTGHIIHKISKLLLIVSLVLQLCDAQDFYAGFYSYHPAYLSDRPIPRDYGRIPLGLPVGGYTMNGKGPPTGLTAYVLKFGGWNSMWKAYHSLDSPFSAQKVYGQPWLFTTNFIEVWH